MANRARAGAGPILSMGVRHLPMWSYSCRSGTAAPGSAPIRQASVNPLKVAPIQRFPHGTSPDRRGTHGGNETAENGRL